MERWIPVIFYVSISRFEIGSYHTKRTTFSRFYRAGLRPGNLNVYAYHMQTSFNRSRNDTQAGFVDLTQERMLKQKVGERSKADTEIQQVINFTNAWILKKERNK